MINPFARTHIYSACATMLVALTACGDGWTDATADPASASVGPTRERPAAANTGSTVRISAKGSLAGNGGPKMALRINGVVVTTTEVRSSTYQDYIFSVPTIPAGSKIDVVFTNDAVIKGSDRNLWVASMTVGGLTLKPTNDGVKYDRGGGNKAFDGVDVLAGQEFMPWSGALRFQIPALTTSPPEPAIEPAPAPVTLQSLSTVRDYVTGAVTSTASCKLGYVQPADAMRIAPAPLPADGGGATFTPTQLATWKERTGKGPFIAASDYTKGSPGDWSRISANASTFLANGDRQVALSMTGSELYRAGSNARDAAFYFLITRDIKYRDAVRKYLIDTVANPEADLTQSFCYRYLDGRSVPDAPFTQAGWMLRLAVTYDYVRRDLSSDDRLVIENFLRRNANWLVANLDWAIESIFPKRRTGDYLSRTGDAAATSLSSAVVMQRFDTNGDCKIDSSDDPSIYVARTHVNGDGSLGRPITLVSQRYNNRRSAQAAAVGALGAVLDDDEMLHHAQRYFMEWLAYSVYADGAEGEYARNGDYCVPKMGVSYSQANIQGALLTMTLGLRRSDRTILDYNTVDGLWGTESSSAAPKTLRGVVKNYLDLSTQKVAKYMHEPWKSTQEPREMTHLGRLEANYNNEAKATDNFQELGMLLHASAFPDLPIAGVILRESATTSLRFPSANGNSLSTGAVPWLDQMGAFPAVYLLR